MLKILVVDDEKIFRMRIKSHLKNHHVIEASQFNSAIEELSKNIFDICFIDLNLDKSGNELLGFEVLKYAHEKGIYCIIMSSLYDDSIVEHAYDLGCMDFYNKGHEDESVTEVLNRYLLNKDNYLEKYFLIDKFPTKSLAQIKQLKKIIPIIRSDFPISIVGESGTGKTLLAQEIHLQSSREGKFVAVNCSAMNEELLESELFGHNKGAFTGAVNEVKGKLALANNGTLFLDELGSMSLKMQTKLLKAVEEKSFYPVNSDRLIQSDFRIISATLDNLEDKIKSGEFRFDLYQRICGINIELLPLRERKEDLEDIVKGEIERNIINGRRFVLSKDVKEFLINYPWHGNFREIKRVFHLLSLEANGHIKIDQIKKHLNQEEKQKNKSSLLNEGHYKLAEQMGLSEFIESIEREVVQYSFTKNKGAIRKTMSQLKINQSKLYRYVKVMDINQEMKNNEVY